MKKLLLLMLCFNALNAAEWPTDSDLGLDNIDVQALPQNTGANDLSLSQQPVNDFQDLPTLPYILEVAETTTESCNFEGVPLDPLFAELNSFATAPPQAPQQNHLTSHDSSNAQDKSFICEWNGCNLKFTEEKEFYKHVHSHTKKEDSKICLWSDICKKSFKTRSLLVKHLRTHTKEKPFKCTICDRSFSQKGTFTRHTRTHTNEKPFKCTICNASFSDKTTIKRHTRTHTGEKPYPCTTCGRRFTQKGNLTRHIRTHTDEKPYQCQHCKKRFIRSDKRNEHQKKQCLKGLTNN